MASFKDLKKAQPRPPTTEEKELGWYPDEVIAWLEGVEVSTIENRVYSGKNHPPCSGRGKGRRWPKAEYDKWKLSKLRKEVG